MDIKTVRKPSRRGFFIVTDCQLGSQGEERNPSSPWVDKRGLYVKAMLLGGKSIVIRW